MLSNMMTSYKSFHITNMSKEKVQQDKFLTISFTFTVLVKFKICEQNILHKSNESQFILMANAIMFRKYVTRKPNDKCRFEQSYYKIKLVFYELFKYSYRKSVRIINCATESPSEYSIQNHL